MKNIEILAPAGSLEGLYAALRMGADAVYVGTHKFGARAYADNPSVEELTEALTFAHLRKKKIYLTVNTLLNDRELEHELFPIIRPLYEAGLDACIVQDMGVLSFLHENFPGMELHASTQMTLFTGEEAEILRPFGVTRYVPARELTIEEIRQARRQTDMEIEVFVHGALCYCYSGQCLMSEVIGGRSGNRGMCAQPCRLTYRIGQRSGSFLSTKDICTLPFIPDLVEAGIDSFKIEGRMKKMEYSAYTAYLYRYYTDFYLEEGRERFAELVENKESSLWRDYRRSQDLYNRGGFSGGFLFEKNKENTVYPEKNGHFGTPAGEVIYAGGGKTKFLAWEKLYPQDVLEFRNEDGSPAYEYTVKEGKKTGDIVETRVKRGSHIYPKQKVYRTKNAMLLSRIRTQIKKAVRAYPLQGTLKGELNQPVKLIITGNEVEACTEGDILEKAKNYPITEEDIEIRLNKLGDTEYRFSALNIDIPEGAFLPLGGLKKLRRQAVQKWEQAAVSRRTARKKPVSFAEETEEKKGNVLPLISVASLPQLKAAVSGVKNDVIFHLKLEDIPSEDWEEAAAILKGKACAVSFPRILRGAGRLCFEEEWRTRGQRLKELPMAAVIINSPAMLLYARKWWKDTLWYGEENLYMENRMARAAYASLGIYPAPTRVYGRTAVMVTENCVRRTLGQCRKQGDSLELITPKGDEFVVVNHCKYCYNTIYAKKSVKSPDRAVGKRLDFTWETPDEVRKVIQKWNF